MYADIVAKNSRIAAIAEAIISSYTMNSIKIGRSFVIQTIMEEVI
jgi:hypothetical protein